MTEFSLQDQLGCKAAGLCCCSWFGLGASWGGYENLVTVADTRDRERALVRLHIGLEDVAALIEDLQRGFAAAG